MQQKRWSRKLLIVSGALLLLLAGCGNAQNGLTGSPNATTTATVILRGMPTPRPVTPVPTIPGSGTVPPGQVVITVAKSSYASNETIIATITNGLASTILVRDHQSACTLLTLQRQTGKQWVAQAPCRLSTATHLLLIPAHTSRMQSLAPGSTPWTGGQHRLMLSYTMGTADENRAGTFTDVYSLTFVLA
jgi:hypothetical protein